MSDLEDRGREIGEEWARVIRDQADDVYLKFGEEGCQAFWDGVVEGMAKKASPASVIALVGAAYEEIFEETSAFLQRGNPSAELSPEVPVPNNFDEAYALEGSERAKWHARMRKALSKACSFNDRAFNRLQGVARESCRLFGHDFDLMPEGYTPDTCQRCEHDYRWGNNWNNPARTRDLAIWLLVKSPQRLGNLSFRWVRSESPVERYEVPPEVMFCMPIVGDDEEGERGIRTYPTREIARERLVTAADRAFARGWRPPVLNDITSVEVETIEPLDDGRDPGLDMEEYVTDLARADEEFLDLLESLNDSE